MRRIVFICAALAALACAGAAAQSGGVYKWKDAKGVTHYSDSPPPDGRYGNVQPNAQARVSAPAKPDPRCATARGNIEKLKGANADIGLDKNGDGKPDAVMTAEQRTAQLKLAEAAAKTYCATPAP